MLEWNVWWHSFNSKEIKTYNVFDHWGFMEDLKKNYKKNKKNKDAFLEKLRTDVMYWYWSKCEWEIVLAPWVGKADEIKIDVYDQLKINWDKFCEYVWENRGELK